MMGLQLLVLKAEVSRALDRIGARVADSGLTLSTAVASQAVLGFGAMRSLPIGRSANHCNARAAA